MTKMVLGALVSLVMTFVLITGFVFTVVWCSVLLEAESTPTPCDNDGQMNCVPTPDWTPRQ